MNKVVLDLKHGQAKVVGPEELISLIESTVRESSYREEAGDRISALLSEWFVECSITGESIPVSELKYWNVEKQEVYKSPEEMPFEDRYDEELVANTLTRWGITSDEPKQ